MFRLPIATLVLFSMSAQSTVCNPAHDAARAGDVAALEAALGSGVAIEETDFVLGTPLHVAVSGGALDIVAVLAEAGADLEAASEVNGARPVHLAADLSDTEMLDLLLALGANPNARDAEGRTPLHRAAILGDQESVAVLIDNGANLEAVDERYGATPLSIAALSGKIGSVQALVEAGANLEARDNAGRTVLREAATITSWSEVGGPVLIDYLVSAGADVNAHEDNGRSILGWAKFRAPSDPIYEKIEEVLRRHGAS